jgi:hypothetical protein
MEDRVPHIYAHFADVVFDPRESATIRGQAAALLLLLIFGPTTPP